MNKKKFKKINKLMFLQIGMKATSPLNTTS